MKKIILLIILTLVLFFPQLNTKATTVEIELTIEKFLIPNRSAINNYGASTRDYGFWGGVRFTITNGSAMSLPLYAFIPDGIAGYKAIQPYDPIKMTFDYNSGLAPYSINLELQAEIKNPANIYCTTDCTPVSGSNWYVLTYEPQSYLGGQLDSWNDGPCPTTICVNRYADSLIAVPSSSVYKDTTVAWDSYYWRLPLKCLNLEEPSQCL